MPYVSTTAGRVFYRERGAGPPIVLLHAALHDHTDFDLIAEPLSADHKVIAVDWPGHGESDPAPARLSARLFADVLAEVVRGLPPAVFIGNSVGGYAAAKLAIDRPDQVSGLVLVNAGGFIAQNIVTRACCRLLGVKAVNHLVMPRMVPSYMKVRTDFDRAIARRVVDKAKTAEGARIDAALWKSFATVDFDLRPAAARLTAPTLLVWGERDPVIPLSAGRTTHQSLAGSQLETLDTGHVVFASEPDRFLSLVRPFIETVSGKARA
ncbi:alpha/beta fold hydrolase [Fodinicola feengrottensis]|uniref:AB hydrolase-1 domain-containing protein n=1 Tax=Fodinicola feengrottensis TaxID=435914 RepID=A0ABP4T9B3_9ACTN|nr:alpha/beta hydrolase [Fodinicola feengrottensis]